MKLKGLSLYSTDPRDLINCIKQAVRLAYAMDGRVTLPAEFVEWLIDLAEQTTLSSSLITQSDRSSERLRRVRERLGESQATFGIRFGVDQSTIHRWETDGVPERGTALIAVERVIADIELCGSAETP